MIFGINGSHRKEKTTHLLLNYLMNQFQKKGFETEMIDLVDYHIKYCIGCNRCLIANKCSIQDDDMEGLANKMLNARCIIIATPVYFANVTSRLKTFIDRTRFLHMKKDLLKGKIGASVVVGGLQYGGQELVMQIIDGYFLGMGMKVAKPRLMDSPIYNSGLNVSLYKGMNGEKILYKKLDELIDPLFIKSSEELVENIIRELI